MKKLNSRAAAFLLFLFLPLSSLAQGPISGEPKNGPEKSFSLVVYSIPAAPAISVQAVSPAAAPSTSPAPEKFTFKSLTRDFLKDAGEIWSYPLHIRTRDFLPIAGLAILTGVLIYNDEEIHRTFLDYRMDQAWVKAVGPVITEMGSYGAWGTAALFVAFGLVAKDDKAVETGTLALSAIVQSGILVQFLKGFFGRQRPSWADGVDQWSGPIGFSGWFETGVYGKYDSFPSGHSITAFSLAAVVAGQYQDSVWVPILAYATATGVALSRVTEGRHWLSDCLVGSVLGYVIGRMVVTNHRHRYHILPQAGVDHGKLSLALTLTGG
jgi:membrane-associated phospholipid phosphatase